MLSAWLPKVLLPVMVALVLDARRLTVVDGYMLRDGSIHPAKDLIIDFADGRRLRANQVDNGGTNIGNDVMQLLAEHRPVTATP